MKTTQYDLSDLFRQLGLSGAARDIDAFVVSHHLRAGVTLPHAAFWSPVQAEFLTQALADDSDWSAAADELAVRLG